MGKLTFETNKIANKDNVIPRVEIGADTALMDAVICLKEGTIPNENSLPSDNDYTYKVIDTGSYAGKKETLAGGIAARDKKGNLWTGEPVDDVDCTNKKYVNDITDEKANGRIPKPSVIVGAPVETVVVMRHDDYTEVRDENDASHYSANDSAFRDVVVDSGNVWSKENVNAASRCLVMRDINGNLWTGTPVDEQDCVPYSMYKALLERVKALEQKA